jgi:transcriptional regulator with XRE-family HTH domain
MNIYQYDSLSSYLVSAIDSRKPKKTSKTQIAKDIGVSPSYLSQILSNKAKPSLDFALKVGQLFQLAYDETDYLLLLAQQQVSEDKECQSYFQQKIEATRNARLLERNLGTNELKTTSTDRKSSFTLKRVLYLTPESVSKIQKCLLTFQENLSMLELKSNCGSEKSSHVLTIDLWQ